ncbi:MAG: CoA transferase [Desulfobacterales bacterium]|nr:CoA transferase [Desulfobacterales bacterium]
MYHTCPLEGIKVLDFTQVLSGPFGTMLLGDLGAEIIKVEPPITGDSTRGSGPPFQQGESAYFFCVNRNKKSICVDLKKKEGVEVIRRIVARGCDVVAESFRPGVMDRLGLGYKEMKKIKGDLIYSSLSAFGNKGPYRDRPGFELIVQGLTGLVSITTEPGGEPAKIQPQIVDLGSGMFQAFSILAALYHKQRTGQGQRVETSLLESTIAIMANLVGIYFMTGEVPMGLGTRNPQLMPSQAFKTRDSYMLTVIGGVQLWARFCKALGKPEWITDENLSKNLYRVEYRYEVEKMIEEVTTTKTTEEWIEIFEEHQVPVSPINTIEEMFEDPQVKSLDMVVTINHSKAGKIKLLSPPWKLSETPGGVKLPPPVLGEHTTQVLKEKGFSLEEIESLKRKGVIFGQ